MTFPAKNTDILFPYHLLCAVSLSQVCREALSKAAWIDHYKETDLNFGTNLPLENLCKLLQEKKKDVLSYEWLKLYIETRKRLLKPKILCT